MGCWYAGEGSVGAIVLLVLVFNLSLRHVACGPVYLHSDQYILHFFSVS